LLKVRYPCIPTQEASLRDKGINKIIILTAGILAIEHQKDAKAVCHCGCREVSLAPQSIPVFAWITQRRAAKVKDRGMSSANLFA
jgi:hypothetical protein